MIETLPTTIIETPFRGFPRGGAWTARTYLEAAMRDSIRERGEAPFASHLIYPLIGLDDDDPDDRRLGMAAGFSWFRSADRQAVYLDFGLSRGMREGLEMAVWCDLDIQLRWILGPPRDLELAREIIQATKGGA